MACHSLLFQIFTCVFFSRNYVSLLSESRVPSLGITCSFSQNYVSLLPELRSLLSELRVPSPGITCHVKSRTSVRNS